MHLSDNSIAHSSSLREPGSFSLITNHNRLDSYQNTAGEEVILPTTASVVIYESHLAEPRVIRIPFTTPTSFVGEICATVHSQLELMGETLPYMVLKELADNFIHADYLNPMISITDSGKQILFSDSGPGIPYPTSAIRAGFTTASNTSKKYIRGVGAGFTIVNDYCKSEGLTLSVESNLGKGTVVCLSKESYTENTNVSADNLYKKPLSLDCITPRKKGATDIPAYALNERQKAVLTVLLHNEDAGPQLIADCLGMGVSTAFRDLKVLESYELAEKLPNKKSKLTELGFEYIDYLASH